jgi:hypothetical protein
MSGRGGRHIVAVGAGGVLSKVLATRWSVAAALLSLFGRIRVCEGGGTGYRDALKVAC